MHRLIAIVLLTPLAACQSGGGNDQAKALIASHCAACHTVPGVAGASGKVGPSLAGIAKRSVIAGKFANNRPTLVRYLMHPQVMVPGNAMPEMGLTQAQAMTIADYLYTLDKP